MAFKRKRMPMKRSKKLFKKTAGKTHKKNVTPPPLRGGYRL